MSEPASGQTHPAGRGMVVAVAVLALLAAALSAYMWYESVQLKASTGGMAICPEFDLISCKEVLQSPYAVWLGLPIASAGVATYGGLLLATLLYRASGSTEAQRLWWTAGLTLAALGTLSGFWLLYVQIFEIGKICYLCDVVHACGLVSLLLLLLRARPTGPLAARGWFAAAVGVAGLAVFAGGQILFPPPDKVEIVELGGGGNRQATTAPAPATQTQPVLAAGSQSAALPSGRYFSITDITGKELARLDLEQEIVLGDPQARHTIVEIIDFGCPQCKKQLEQMHQVWERHPKWFRMICLIVPSNKKCNKHTAKETPYVCEMAEAALAVHKYRPELYLKTMETFYRLQSGMSDTLAWQVSKEICGIDEATLAQWQKDGSLKKTIERHVDVGIKMMADFGVRGLPAMYADGIVLTGGASSVESLENMITILIGSPDGKIAPRPRTAATQPASSASAPAQAPR